MAKGMDGSCSCDGDSKMVGNVVDVGDADSVEAALEKLSWCRVGSESARWMLDGVQL